MKKPLITLLLTLFFVQYLSAQKKLIDPVQFFLDETIIKATLEVPVKTVLKKSNKTKEIAGQFKCTMPDGSIVNDPIQVSSRGKFRKDYCFLPPLKIKFKKSDSSYLSPLKTLKLVNTCRTGNDNNSYLLKEYLVYKIYNMLTDMSFRVRLLDLNYVDSDGSKKSMQRYAFLIEDIDDLAKRNDKHVFEGSALHTEKTNRAEMTLLAIFEYMIGNTDWAVPVTHNIKLITANDSFYTAPIAVPYDFDYCGLVNAQYAIPDENLNIESVTERVYRGFPRNMEELRIAFKKFNDNKQAIYKLINEFDLLSKSNRDEMLYYLDQFYKDISNESSAEFIFIKNARTQ